MARKKNSTQRFYIDFELKEVKKAVFDSKSKTYKTKTMLTLPAYRLFVNKKLADEQLKKFIENDLITTN